MKLKHIPKHNKTNNGASFKNPRAFSSLSSRQFNNLFVYLNFKMFTSPFSDNPFMTRLKNFV